MNVKTIATCAEFAAILCVFSIISIPIGPVPISLGLFGIMVAAVILGAKRATISTAVFILLGAVGVPVFAGAKGGFQVLLGATGGYIWSYILTALIIGFVSTAQFKKKSNQNKWVSMGIIFAACIAGIAVCYALGTAQFMLVMNKGLGYSLGICVIPFIPFDLAKAVVSTYAGYTVRRSLTKAGLI